MSNSLITLTTDFGDTDWFVGTMKGVILNINPNARIVDIGHGIPAGDVRAGAFALASACGYFPPKTIHVAVVDPGVGSKRVALAVQTNNFTFIGPDNGLLSLALKSEERITAIYRIENQQYFLPLVSRTFHGRDVFAPVAAQLSKGLPLAELGPKQDDYEKIAWPKAVRELNSIKGEIIYIDRFGNAVTNITNELASSWDESEVVVRGKTKCPVKAFYRAVPVGKPVAVPGSSDLLEIAVNAGNAAQQFKLEIGTKLTLRPAQRRLSR